MNKLGKIKNVYELTGKIIVSVEIGEPSNIEIKIGEKIKFDDGTVLEIKGIKFWPNSKEVDLLFDQVKYYPNTNSYVYKGHIE